MTAPAGWYQDPANPGAKRYWDGHRWTESVQAPPPGGAGGATHLGPNGDGPPYAPVAAPPAPTGPQPTDGLDDLGSWLRRSFAVLPGHWKPLTIYFLLLPLPLWVALYVVVDRLVGGLSWLVDAERVDGFDAGLTAVAVALFLVAIVVSAVSYVAGHRYLIAAHGDVAPERWSDVLRPAALRAPRFIGIAALLLLATYVLILLPFGLGAALFAYDRLSLTLVLVLGLVVLPLSVVLLVWLWTKLSFIGPSTAVVPAHRSAIRASAGISRGRFWRVLGRLVILQLVLAVISLPMQIFAQLFTPLLVFSGVELNDRDQLLIDGIPAAEVDVIPFSEFLPSPALALLYFGVIALFSAAQQTVSASAHGVLYLDAGGPDDLGIGGVGPDGPGGDPRSDVGFDPGATPLGPPIGDAGSVG